MELGNHVGRWSPAGWADSSSHRPRAFILIRRPPRSGITEPVSDPASAVKTALRALARRWQALQAEIDDLDMQLTPLVTFVASELLALAGVGVEIAGQLLVTSRG